MSAENASSNPVSTPVPPQESFGQLMANVRTALLNRLEQEFAKKGGDLSFTQYLVMKKLATAGPITATELARSISHDAGAMTRLLDRLTAKDYLRRLPHAQDRRALQIEMTDAGRVVWARMSDCAERVTEMALAGISEADRDQLTDTLQRIHNTLLQAGSID